MLWFILGWTGTVLYLGAYVYVTWGRRPRVWSYYGTNLLAALLVCVSSVTFGTWQTVAINGFWALVSLMALFGRNVVRDQLRLPVLSRLLTAVLTVLCLVAGVVWLLEGFRVAAALLGWGSTTAFCIGYLLFAAQGIQRRTFLAYNLYAALVLLPQLFLDGNWPVVGLETVWGLISLGGLVTSRLRGEPVEPEHVLSDRGRPDFS